MKLSIFRRREDAKVAHLYGAIVAQARLPSFYRDYGVPDNVGGRFEVVVLHLSLLLARTGAGSAVLRAFGQRVFDHFCQDMDDQLREMGVGDLAVPKRMRGMADAFYGRQAAYRAALASADPERLENALARNIFADSPPPDAVPLLAAYVRRLAGHLAALDEASILAARLDWPDMALPCVAFDRDLAECRRK
jgi:cytochrome b pre-mRNA-processing protein 3